jgi:N-acylglucosamine 2-epimerase
MFERVNRNGSTNLEEPEGRTITPGHCMESCWFCMREGRYRNDRKTIDRAAEIMDWTMQRGWDKEYGGIFNFVDVLGKSPGHHDEDWGEDQDWDEKIFWVHGESLYALLLGYVTTKQERLFDWYKKVHFWSFRHFPDREFGEWFGYLRRDGSVSQTLKGTIKGLFHLPRAYIFAMLLLEHHPEERI